MGGGWRGGRALSLVPISRRIFYRGAGLIGYLIWREDWLLIEWGVIVPGIESRRLGVVNEQSTKKYVESGSYQINE